mgnify:CR=1 FL=1
MKILVTGSSGFVGRNLVWNLKALQDGKNRTRPGLNITRIYKYDMGSTQEELEEACREADFVFHLAGVNRPAHDSEFMDGNCGLLGLLLNILKKFHNCCPVMYAGSIQASLEGRFQDSAYGKSKLAAEKRMFRHAGETGAEVLVYRFPNLFGKWCRPNYNSAVATFCHAQANGLEYTVNDPGTELELLYIDDLIEEMLDALEGREHRCEYHGLEAVADRKGRYCYVPGTYHASLGEITGLLREFHAVPETLLMPQMPDGSFEKKLYSTYLSYLPESGMAYALKASADSRGSFAELLHLQNCGQISVNTARPGAVRGQHWHNSKWEIFIVVSGHGLIQQRRIGMNPETGRHYPVTGFEVTGEQMKAVQILPGYAHSITNLSKTQDLVTVMWANEAFDKNHPDTFYEPVAAGENASAEENRAAGEKQDYE